MKSFIDFVNESYQKNLNFTKFEITQKLIDELDKRNIKYTTDKSRDDMDRLRIKHKGHEYSVIVGHDSYGGMNNFEMVEIVNGHLKDDPEVYSLEKLLKVIDK